MILMDIQMPKMTVIKQHRQSGTYQIRIGMHTDHRNDGSLTEEDKRDAIAAGRMVISQTNPG